MATTPMSSMLSIFVRVLVLWSLLSLLFNCCCHAQNLGDRKVRIVYLDPSVRSSKALALKLLGKVLEGGKAAESLIYTIHIINGFVARLTESEAERLGRLKMVVRVALDDRSYHIEPVGTFAPEGN